MADEKLTVTAPNARELFEKWIAQRGGVLRWRNVNLSNPDAGDQYTPATTMPTRPNEEPKDYPAPHWSVQKGELITDIERFRFVREMKEVDRFEVVPQLSSNSLSLKLTDESSAELRERQAKIEKEHEKPAYYHFEYETEEAVITIPIFEDEPTT